MIKIVCDECEKELRETQDGKEEKRVTLKMHVEGTGSYPIDLDLCVACAKRYVKVLKGS